MLTFLCEFFFIPNLIFNRLGHLNESLLYAFTGDIVKSQTVLDYEWVLFYPVFFVMGQWDRYRVGFETQNCSSPPISHKLPFILASMFSV